jgi:hypothetical protein
MVSKRPRRSERERREFEAYLRACTDAQVQGVLEKEHAANRHHLVRLAKSELAYRANRRIKGEMT